MMSRTARGALRSPARRLALMAALLFLAIAAPFALRAQAPVSADEIQSVRAKIIEAVVDIENAGTVARVRDGRPDHSVITGLREDARLRFARHLAQPLQVEYAARFEPYLSDLAAGRTQVFKVGVTYHDWKFKHEEVSEDSARMVALASKCNPFIDFSTTPPAEGNPCGPMQVTAALVRVDRVWVLTELRAEQTEAP